MYQDDNGHPDGPAERIPNFSDEGGLRAPPHLKGWRKAWWWFDFIVLVNLARLRFIAILVVIGAIILHWDTLAAYYDKWTRPEGATDVAGADSGYEYYCPMHPSIVRDNNKEVCPICFMPLTKRKKGEATAKALPAGIVNRVQLSPYRVVLAGVQTWPVQYVSLTKDIKAVGYIEFNERGQKTVAARSAGRIDKLYASETGQMVNAGDDLALIYSPDLMVTIQNLIEAKHRGNNDLVESARARLKLLGIDDQQIDEFLAANKVDTHVRIRSPLSGHVINKYVKEGQYVQEGMPLYDVADLSTVWIQAQVYEEDLSSLPAGYEHGPKDPNAPGLEVTATTRSYPNEPFHGRLSFIYPHVDQDSRTITVRFELANPGHKLRPGGTAEVAIKILPKDLPALADATSDPHGKEMLEQGKALAVPESSVIDTGNQKIVYRQSEPGVYEGVEVSLGPKMTNPDGAVFYPVLHGLLEGNLVVTSGSFLVDAETRLNPAAGSIYFGNSSGSKDTSSVSNVRPSTPDDPNAKIKAALAKLSDEDRKLVEAQRFCPILTSNQLGSMGPPVKVMVDGQPVFLCCSGCKQKALDNPTETLAKVAELKQKTLAEPAGHDAVAAPAPTMAEKPEIPSDAVKESEIKEALAKLSPEDQKLVESQRLCPVTKNRLGSMGAPFKLMIEGEPVFLCCDGCKDEALKDPKATLAKVAQLKQANSASK
ncbi:MAG TPA: efflux RND transporter periplasmic adaptor subunit [Pirellulales bacterium]|jgi:Cu(I)/Ag(I) efflux system membrane fusion protein|nr:efflux RND transporter periplasmic adaptor subunit [Pirellulales bacterium]